MKGIRFNQPEIPTDPEQFWVDCPGFFLYEISSFGFLRYNERNENRLSLLRMERGKKDGRLLISLYTGLITYSATVLDSRGKPLRKDPIKQKCIAELMIKAFTNIEDPKYLNIVFKDGNPENLRISNLEYKEDEVWYDLPTPHHSAPYRVSNLGRVKFGEHLVKTHIGDKGYLCFISPITGYHGITYVHHLVASAICNYPEGSTITHKNQIVTDNRACNLGYRGQRETRGAIYQRIINYRAKEVHRMTNSIGQLIIFVEDPFNRADQLIAINHKLGLASHSSFYSLSELLDESINYDPAFINGKLMLGGYYE